MFLSNASIVDDFIFHYVFAGQSNLLRIIISTMLRQGLIKSLSGDGNTHINNSLSAILKAVKKACCDGKLHFSSQHYFHFSLKV